MSQYNYIPTIERQESRLESIVITVACLAVFAFIGVLLALGV